MPVALVFVLVLLHGRALDAPFFSDDLLFLDKVRGAGFADLWAPRDLAYHWYRPWSRELHYWTLAHAFGTAPRPFHLAAWALWLAAMTGYGALVRRLAGMRAAVVATAGVAALSAWAPLLDWSAGAQDLWMMVWALLSLLAFTRDRKIGAAVALAFALLSKETAVLVPAIAFAHALLIDRDRVPRALARVAPLMLVTLAWLLVHRSLWAGHEPLPARFDLSSALAATARTVLVALNLDAWPQPWPSALPALVTGLVVAAVLGFAVAIGFAAARRAPDAEQTRRRDPRATVLLGIAWGVLGLVPALVPALTWQPYYGLWSALGFWLAASVPLARHPAIAIAAVAAVAILGPARTATPTQEWSSAWSLRAGQAFIGRTEAFLRARHPELPRDARLFFTGVPVGSVFIMGPGNAPALRVWYRDSTVSGSLWNDFAPRAHDARPGPDLFFRHDGLAGWIEITAGAENVARERAANPRWADDHRNLGYLFTGAGEYARAATEYEKLAESDSTRGEDAAVAALAWEAAGDTVRAARWAARAAARPGADDATRAQARRLRRFLDRAN